MRKLLSALLVFIIVVFLGTGLLAWHMANGIHDIQLSNEKEFELLVTKGDTVYKIRQQIKEYADINKTSLRLWLKLHPEQSQIQTGLYVVKPEMKFVDLLSQINSGKVKQFSVTMLEGHTLAQWLQHLGLQNGLIQDLPTLKDAYAQMEADNGFCKNEHASLEGCLLPDTYFYSYQDSAFSILERAYKAMQVNVDSAWNSRFLDVPIKSQYEMLILASIIEKETAIDAERAEIAGVFVNRLNKNMRLQTDPTVIYGIGEAYAGDITRQHLRTPTPYNTYTFKGLPITPIAMPSKKSIQAAVRPALTDAYYFVATGDGGHQFSVTLDEHNIALRAYLKKLKQNRKEQAQ